MNRHPPIVVLSPSPQVAGETGLSFTLSDLQLLSLNTSAHQGAHREGGGARELQ